MSQHRVELREASADLVAPESAAIRPVTFLHRGCHQAFWPNGLPRLDPRSPSPATFFEVRDAGLCGAERHSTTSATKHNYEHAPDGCSPQTKPASSFCSLATNDALRRLSFEVWAARPCAQDPDAVLLLVLPGFATPIPPAPSTRWTWNARVERPSEGHEPHFHGQAFARPACLVRTLEGVPLLGSLSSTRVSSVRFRWKL